MLRLLNNFWVSFIKVMVLWKQHESASHHSTHLAAQRERILEGLSRFLQG
jgi:hypothetical protein